CSWLVHGPQSNGQPWSTCLRATGRVITGACPTIESYHAAFDAISTSVGPWTSHTLRITTRPPLRHSSAGAARLHTAHSEAVGRSRRSVTGAACHRGARPCSDRSGKTLRHLDPARAPAGGVAGVARGLCLAGHRDRARALAGLHGERHRERR